LSRKMDAGTSNAGHLREPNTPPSPHRPRPRPRRQIISDVCKLREDEALWRIGSGFVVRDLPWTEEQLRKIPPFEFENWL
jgi:hypothetical protein